MTLERAEVDDKAFLIILIHEFDEIPVICKGDGPSNLRKGAIYVRPYRMPETSEVPTQTELREILDMAVEKGIRKYLERQSRLGINLSVTTTVKDEDKFKAELGDLQ